MECRSVRRRKRVDAPLVDSTTCQICSRFIHRTGGPLKNDPRPGSGFNSLKRRIPAATRGSPWAASVLISIGTLPLRKRNSDKPAIDLQQVSPAWSTLISPIPQKSSANEGSLMGTTSACSQRLITPITIARRKYFLIFKPPFVFGRTAWAYSRKQRWFPICRSKKRVSTTVVPKRCPPSRTRQQ